MQGQALIESVKSGNLEEAKRILDDCDALAKVLAHRDEMGLSALDWSVKKGRSDALSLLLEAGSRPNEPNEEGFTPLMEAARRGDTVCMELLLVAGASPHRKAERRGHMVDALGLAVEAEEVAACAMLLAAGADPAGTEAARGGWMEKRIEAIREQIGPQLVAKIERRSLEKIAAASASSVDGAGSSKRL